MARILLVEDEPGLVEFLRMELSLSGDEVVVAQTGTAALSRQQEEQFDAVLLDISLPDIDGFAVCKTIRSRKDDVPILMLTARGATSDKVTGLDSGADDYLVKPFTIEELGARMRAVWRRKQPRDMGPDSTALRVGDLSVQLDQHRVYVGGERVDVTLREFELLVYLMRHPEQVFSREELLQQVWGYESAVATNVVDVYIGYLRQKLDKEKRYIHTVRGSGYSFYEGQP